MQSATAAAYGTDAAGLVLAAAPDIADELLAALQRFNGLAPIPH